MKWYQQIFLIFYGIISLYFLYLAIMHSYVFIANKSLGHEESFLIPGRNLAIGLLVAGFAFAGWYLIKNTAYQKLGNIILFFPAIVVGLFLLYMITLLIASGGKWN